MTNPPAPGPIRVFYSVFYYFCSIPHRAMCGPCVLDFWHNAGVASDPAIREIEKERENKK